MIICDLLLKGYKIKPHLSGVKRWMWTWALFESWFSDNCGMYVCYRKNTEIDNEVTRNTYKHRSWAAEVKKWLIAYWSFRKPSSVPSTCVGKFKICCNSSSMGSDKWTLQVFGGTPLRQTHTPCNEISTHTPQGGCIVQWWGNAGTWPQIWFAALRGKEGITALIHTWILSEWHPIFVMLNFLTLKNEQWYPPSGELSRIKWHCKHMQIFASTQNSTCTQVILL